MPSAQGVAATTIAICLRVTDQPKPNEKRREAREQEQRGHRPRVRQACCLATQCCIHLSCQRTPATATAIKRIHPKRGGSIAAMLPGEARATPPRDRTVPEFFWPQSALYCALAAHEATHRVVSDGTCFGVFLLRHDSACVCVCVCVYAAKGRGRTEPRGSKSTGEKLGANAEGLWELLTLFSK